MGIPIIFFACIARGMTDEAPSTMAAIVYAVYRTTNTELWLHLMQQRCKTFILTRHVRERSDNKQVVNALALLHAILLSTLLITLQADTLVFDHVCESILPRESCECVLPAFACYRGWMCPLLH